MKLKKQGLKDKPIAAGAEQEMQEMSLSMDLGHDDEPPSEDDDDDDSNGNQTSEPPSDFLRSFRDPSFSRSFRESDICPGSISIDMNRRSFTSLGILIFEHIQTTLT